MGATLCSGEKKSAAAGSDCKRNFEFTESIAAMDWGKATTYVFGHKTPDVDAVASSLSYAALMRALGHNAVAKVSSPVNRETAFIAKRLGFELPELMKYVEPGTRLILTDHADFAQSVDGAREAKILQIIDHHTPGNIDTISPKPYVRRKLIGATCTLIWHLYQEAEIEIDDNAARVLFAGVLSDTKNLTKVNTTSIDIIVLNELAKQLHLPPDSVQSLYQEMSAAALDYSGMTDVQRCWDKPQKEEWIETLDKAVQNLDSDTIIVAHSLGVATTVMWLTQKAEQGKIPSQIRGAFLVSPSDVDNIEVIQSFAPMPLQKLPVPACVVASENDPFVSMERAKFFASAWGTPLFNAGALGHIN